MMAFIGNTLDNLPVTSGKLIFVDSGSGRASDGNAGRDPNVPMATIDAAVARCSANNGDIIVVMPGHAETIAATDIALDVAGVWVFGLGWGSSRPVLTFGAAGSTIAMSAASCRLSNLVLAPGAASVAAAVTITAADCVVENCESRSHATSEFTHIINVNESGTRTIIRDNKLWSFGAAGSSAGIYLDGSDDIEITGNNINGNFGAAAAIDNTTGSDEALRATIMNNIVYNVASSAGDLAISMDVAATGIIAHNIFAGDLDFEANVVGGAMYCVENFVIDATGETGGAWPATAAAS
jgi:hypothetical protein